MSVNWHEALSMWAKPPSETEQSKAERAARMVREALRDATALQSRDFDIVAVGSYRNNTNVRAASDVDLAAVLRTSQWTDLPRDGSLTRDMLGLRDADYTLEGFRRDVSAALAQKFGSPDVEPGHIALTVDESSARLVADLTPYLVHRRYGGSRRADGAWEYLEGIETRPRKDPNRRLIQWPEQHYTNGVAKNDATSRRYKRIVRILKRARNELRGAGDVAAQAAAGETKSIFLEHAVFNVPNDRFNRETGSYYEDLREVVRYLWTVARDPTHSAAMVEVNCVQPLFRSSESWSREQLERFMSHVWKLVGFA